MPAWSHSRTQPSKLTAVHDSARRCKPARDGCGKKHAEHSQSPTEEEGGNVRTSICPWTARRRSFNSSPLVIMRPSISSFIIPWLVGATVARLTPDQKAGGSNPSLVIDVYLRRFCFLPLAAATRNPSLVIDAVSFLLRAAGGSHAESLTGHRRRFVFGFRFFVAGARRRRGIPHWSSFSVSVFCCWR